MAGQSIREPLITRAREVIEAHMKDEGFGVSELAREMKMSRSNLHRRIKSGTGISVSQFVRNIRLKKAQKLLENESYTVAEAAYATGFSSATYFSKCFRNYFGFTPVEVKRKALDLSEPEDRIVNNLSEESKSLLHNFPVQTTSFIGRRNEIETIIGLIKKQRIVTLTGIGGCGKTRLACELVSQLVKDYPDGIWFVDLVPIEAEENVVKQLMTALELTEIPGRDMIDIVIERIRDRKLLIVLDNCEHLLRACAEVSDKLIESVTGLSLLITSREKMNIKGEKVWVIPSLSLTDPAVVIDVEKARRSEAVSLFTDRAKLNNTGFELVENNASTVSAICHRLDGIPLAIELVSSRTRYMDTITMAKRLSEKFDSLPSLDPGTSSRHQTIQATIEWSYNLLSEEEKVLFRRLSVFTGGFDLMAVEEVCADEILPTERILDYLSQLVDRSIIQTVYQPGKQMRYRLLETLQRYASNLLYEKGETAKIRIRYLEYFTRIAEESYEERISSQEKWIIRLQKEHDNMLGAIRWADIHDPESYHLLVGSLSWFWAANSHYATARKFLDKVVSGSIGNKKAFARAMTGYGILLATGGDLQRAIDLLNKGLSLWRELKNRKEEVLVLEQISYALMYTGQDDDFAANYAKQALSLAEQLQDPDIELRALLAVAQGLVNLKNTREAKTVISRMKALAEEMKNLYCITGAHHLLGDCAIMEKKYKESEREYGQSVLSAFKLGDKLQTCFDIFCLAMSVAGQGRHTKALRLNAAVTLIARANDFDVPEEYQVTFISELAKQHIAGTREKLGEELTMKYEDEGRALNLEQAVDYALDFSKD